MQLAFSEPSPHVLTYIPRSAVLLVLERMSVMMINDIRRLSCLYLVTNEMRKEQSAGKDRHGRRES